MQQQPKSAWNFVSKVKLSGNSDQMNRVSALGSDMASDIVDISGYLDEIGVKAQVQMDEMDQLQARVDEVVNSNSALQSAIAHVTEMSDTNLQGLHASLETFRRSSEASQSVATWVRSVEERIIAVEATLKQVERENAEISSIARQVNILAINAKIEAVRAGTYGKGFAVVAEAINELSNSTTRAAEAVSEGVTDLGKNFTELREEAHSIQDVASRVINEGKQTNDEMNGMADQMQSTVNTAGAMKHEAQRISAAIRTFGPAFEAISSSAVEIRSGVEESRTRFHGLVDSSESLVKMSILAGGASEDQKFITYVRKTAADISDAFTKAVERGMISEDDLFNRSYEPIAGTNPRQVMAKFTNFTDAVLPPFQEAALEVDERVVFCAAVDTNGYLSTHNKKFSQPQSGDPVWNTANCRNRRIFDDRVGLKAGRNQDPFLLQVYRRDMGAGNFVLMKDLSAPIFVKGRHWGGLRFAYRI